MCLRARELEQRLDTGALWIYTFAHQEANFFLHGASLSSKVRFEALHLQVAGKGYKLAEHRLLGHGQQMVAELHNDYEVLGKV